MTQLTFQSSKAASTPTLNAWSKEYSAGSVFGVFSLNRKEDENGTGGMLSTLGSSLIQLFETDYFSLEEKDLAGIEEVLQKIIATVPENITLSIALCAFVDDVLYVFSKNGGEILMRRGGVLGDVLSTDEDNPALVSGSGLSQDNDLVVLQTPDFSQNFPKDALSEMVADKPVEELGETFSPLLQNQQNGKAAALFVMCHKKETEEKEQTPQTFQEVAEPIEKESLSKPDQDEDLAFETKSEKEPQEELVNQANTYKQEQTEEKEPLQLSVTKLLSETVNKINIRRFIPSRLPRSKRTVFIGVVILLVVIAVLVFQSIKHSADQKLQNQFEAVYTPAQNKYQEGLSLEGSDKNAARDDFTQAQTLISQNRNNFKEGSTQRKQLDDLLTNVERELSSVSQAFRVNPSEAATGKDPMLDTAISKNVSVVAKDDKAIYYGTDQGISQTVGNGTAKLLIKKDWDTAESIDPYGSNMYVLDPTASQIYKFVAAGDGFAKQNYFSSTIQLSDAKSIAIDGSIWILFSNGQVEKFTKGAQDAYTLSGLDKPFSNPTQIWTTTDSQNLYVLDNGNARIVKIDKTKGYLAQYQNALLNQAKVFDVDEASNTIYFVANNKVYSFPMH